MELSDFMRSELVFLDVEARSKVDIFRKIVKGMARSKVINHPEAFLDEIIERENQAPTCIGRGIALPHTRTIFVNKPIIAFARTRGAVAFSNRPTDNVEFVFLMGTPKNDPNTYLRILGKLCKLLRDQKFRNSLRKAVEPNQILDLFSARWN